MADEVQSLTQEMCSHIYFKKKFMWLHVHRLCAGLNREGMKISEHVFLHLILTVNISVCKEQVITLCNINTDLLTQIIKRA